MVKKLFWAIAVIITISISVNASDVFAKLPANQSTKKTASKQNNLPYDGFVWLGDSLTQGSLGDDNDNLRNAPFEKFKKYTTLPVKGYGFYGYNTNDIFWVYRDENHENQKVDPKKCYILWVGSNDWVIDGAINLDVKSVTDRIDSFLAAGPVNNYLILGTTARKELREQINGIRACDLINSVLSAKYGDHYLDVNSVIGLENSYSGDEIHLNQRSYNRVALAVAKKLGL